MFWLLVLFYAPIVAAIQAPVNMDNLRKVCIVVLPCGGGTLLCNATCSCLAGPQVIKTRTAEGSTGLLARSAAIEAVLRKPVHYWVVETGALTTGQVPALK